MPKFMFATAITATNPPQPDPDHVIQGALLEAADNAAALAAFETEFPAQWIVVQALPGRVLKAFDFTNCTAEQIALGETGLSEAQIDAFRGTMPDWYLAKRGLL